jgi:hypothetical protein
VKVGVDLSVPSHPDIFIIGDTAAVTDQPGIPDTAPTPKQMGRHGRPAHRRVSMGCGAPMWGRSAFDCSFIVFLAVAGHRQSRRLL